MSAILIYYIFIIFLLVYYLSICLLLYYLFYVYNVVILIIFLIYYFIIYCSLIFIYLLGNALEYSPKSLHPPTPSIPSAPPPPLPLPPNKMGNSPGPFIIRNSHMSSKLKFLFVCLFYVIPLKPVEPSSS